MAKIDEMLHVDLYQCNYCTQLTKSTNKGIWRMRVGDWRATFIYDQSSRFIEVIEVYGRGDKSLYN